MLLKQWVMTPRRLRLGSSGVRSCLFSFFPGVLVMSERCTYLPVLWILMICTKNVFWAGWTPGWHIFLQSKLGARKFHHVTPILREFAALASHCCSTAQLKELVLTYKIRNGSGPDSRKNLQRCCCPSCVNLINLNDKIITISKILVRFYFWNCYGQRAEKLADWTFQFYYILKHLQSLFHNLIDLFYKQ